MKQYTAYKDSGIEWLGEMPFDWVTKKLKFFSRIVLGKMLTNEDKGGYFYKPYLRAQNLNWFNVNYEDIKLMWFSENELSQYRIEKDDLLVSEGGEVGRTCMWNNEIEECYIQNSVHKVTVHENNIPKFFQYFFFTLGALGHFDAIVSRVSIAHLTREKLKEVCFFVPERKQQAIITTFLNHKTHQIDDLITKKQKLIELLKEERTAIINKAVTKGLDQAVMKDSRIEWIGEIPEHWELITIKKICKVNPSKSEIKLPESTEVVFLPMEKVSDDGNYDDSELKPISTLKGGYTYFAKGDVILAKITPCFENGKGAFLENLRTQIGFGSTEFHVLRPIAGISDGIYLYYFTHSICFNQVAEAFMVGSAGQKRVQTPFLENFFMPLPPYREQLKIVEKLKFMLTQIDESIKLSTKEIELISEYKISLISEAVTGKIDVRDYQISHA